MHWRDLPLGVETCQCSVVENQRTRIIFQPYTQNMRNRLLENLHLPFWLIKDACWALSWKPLGLIMILPTVSLALYLAIKTRRVMKEFLPNLAIACWITANSIWMSDEFYILGIKPFSLFFFASGLISILIWLYLYFPSEWKVSAAKENR
jgi:hypothetical protein